MCINLINFPCKNLIFHWKVTFMVSINQNILFGFRNIIIANLCRYKFQSIRKSIPDNFIGNRNICWICYCNCICNYSTIIQCCICCIWCFSYICITFMILHFSICWIYFLILSLIHDVRIILQITHVRIISSSYSRSKTYCFLFTRSNISFTWNPAKRINTIIFSILNSLTR